MHPQKPKQATLADLDSVAHLFDLYRQFYGKPSDLSAAREFIRQRIELGDSKIYVAHVDGQASGFVQLYPSYSSLSMRSIWALNDLYVVEAVRGHGVATQLIDAGLELARESGAIRLTLSTARTNATAQRLYERLGWKRDEQYLTYSLEVGK